MTSTAPPLVRPRRGRVLVGQVIVNLALFATSAAMISVLLPGRVAALDPQGKVAALATITSIGFVVTAIVQPVIGALSDRTRSRLGRRLPWMVTGATVGALAIGLIGGAPSVLLLGVLWAVAQPALTGVQVSTDAYLVDVFPPARRGLAAGIVGLALAIGAGAGAVLAGAFSDRPVVVGWILAAAIVVAVAIFAALVRDAPLATLIRPRRRVADAARAVAATVAQHPDFIKLLVWRVAFSIAYGSVFSYLLYILTDLIGVPKTDAAHLIGAITAIGGAAAAVSVIGGGWLSDRIGRRRPFVLIGNAVLIAGDLLLLAWPTVPAVLTVAGLFGLGLGLSVSSGRALGSQVLPNPTDGAAVGLGVLNTAANLGQAAAPAIAGLMIGWGGYPAVFVASGVGAVVCSVPIVLVRTVR